MDVESSDKGMLVPRVNIADLNTIAPVTGGTTESLLVYNTNTTTGKGFYYWDGSQWVGLSATPSDDWTTTGNSGTTAGTNFVGTTDNEDLVLAVNGTEEMRILSGDQVSVNDATPIAGDRFTVVGDANEFAVNGYGTGASGVGLYGESASLDGAVGLGGRYGVFGAGAVGVWGNTNGATALGVWANNDNASGTALAVTGTNSALTYYGGAGASIIGATGTISRATGATSSGVLGAGNNQTPTSLVDGNGVSGVGDTGVFGRSSTTVDGTGIIGVGNNNSSIVTNTGGSGIAGTGPTLGVFGYAGEGDDDSANYGNAGGEFVLDSDNDPTTNAAGTGNRARAILAGFDDVTPNGILTSRDSYFGGYFSGGNENSGTPSFAYAGMRYRTGNNGTFGGSTTDYKIIGSGTNSTLFEDERGDMRIMFSPEAPEILFQDFGTGQLLNGRARIKIDPVLKQAIYVDENHPLKVYVTLEGQCNGIYVTDKSADGFTVIELDNGNSNVPFSWQIVASRADTMGDNGRVISKHVGVRLPVGPGQLSGSQLKLVNTVDSEANSLQARNAGKVVQKVQRTEEK